MSKLSGLMVILVVSCAFGAALAAEDVTVAAASSVESTSMEDATETPMSLSRDGEDVVLRSFTIEGEDRVSIRFDRPRISLDLDPRGAPGLGWDYAWDKVDVFPSVTARTAVERTPFTGRPWLREFAQDDVVVFHPEAPEMASWKLTIVDSRGKPAVVRQGRGTPPTTLNWDGRRDDGTPAWPGLTYSFVMETVDPAGNERTTSGRGFGLPSYRLTGEQENVLVFSGREITREDPSSPAIDLSAKALIIETASWLNQAPGGTAPIEVRATARSRGQAHHLAELVRNALGPMVCGNPSRVVTVINVVSNAPDFGVLEIASRRSVE